MRRRLHASAGHPRRRRGNGRRSVGGPGPPWAVGRREPAAQHGDDCERRGAGDIEPAPDRGRRYGHSRRHVMGPERQDSRRAVSECRARAEDELPDARTRVPQLLRDLLVAAPFELTQRKRPALRVGQVAHPGDDPPDLLALLEQGGWLRHSVVLEIELVVVRGALAEQIDRAVVGDPVQPGAQHDLPVAAVTQREEGLQEGLLNGVLGPVGAHETGAVDAQLVPIAACDLRPGPLGPGPRERDQALVALVHQRCLREPSGVGSS